MQNGLALTNLFRLLVRATGLITCRKRKERLDWELNLGHPYFMKGMLTTALPSQFVEESSTPTGWGTLPYHSILSGALLD
jgi:hypothetical protein